jgi:hypothetical protein
VIKTIIFQLTTNKMKTCSVAIVIAIALSVADAKKKYIAKIPNGGNVAGVDALGHVDVEGGGELNAFGSAFSKAGYSWTKALCEADSDNDGQTNGQELGDPCCEWTEGGTPRWSAGVSHPGDASKKADSSLWKNVKCGGALRATASPAGSSAPVNTSPVVPSTGESQVVAPSGDASAPLSGTFC